MVLDAKSNIRAYGLSHIVSRLICTQKAVTPAQHQIDFCAPKTVTLEFAHEKRLHWHIGFAHEKRLHWHNVKFDFAQQKRLQKQTLHFKIG